MSAPKLFDRRSLPFSGTTGIDLQALFGPMRGQCLCSRWLRNIFSMAWRAERAWVWSFQLNEGLSTECGEPSVCIFDARSERNTYSLKFKQS